MSTPIFKQFVVSEGKIQKQEFEPAENIFTDLLVIALSTIGASGASPGAKERVTEMARPLITANCNEVSVVEAVVEQEIKAIKNPAMSKEVSELWKKMKELKDNAPCPRGVLTNNKYSGTSGVLAGTTYSGWSGNYNHVTPADIDKKYSKKQMEELLANIENEKIKNEIAKKEAREKQIQEEHESQIHLHESLKSDPDAVVQIIEENANKEWDTKEQKQFWQDKQKRAEEYIKAVNRGKKSKEEQVNSIIRYVFRFAGVAALTFFISTIKDEINYHQRTKKKK